MSETPDYGHVIGVGDVELIPGECAVATDEARGGRLELETRDREGQTRTRRVGVGKGRVTLVSVDEVGKASSAKTRCDQQPF